MSEAAPASEAAGSEAPKSEAEPEPVSEAGEPKSEAVSEAPKSEAHRFKRPLQGSPKNIYFLISAKPQFLKPHHPRAHPHLRALHLAKVSQISYD